MPMSEQVLNLLLQIPLAGVVAFVVIVFLKHLKETNAQMINFMTEQAETNRLFLAAQREQMNQAIGRMAEELKMMRETLAEKRGTQKRNRNF